MNKLAIILTTIFLVASYACKTKLDKDDLTLLLFQEGDTLIFRSSESEFDTTFIVKREIIYPGYNPIELHKKHLPQIGRILYFNKNVPYINNGKEMVYLQKDNPDQKADGFISYFNSTFFLDTDYFNEVDDTIVFKGNRHTDIIKITDSYKINLTCDNLRTLWWSKQHGLLKYETCKGKIWARIK